MVGILVSYVAKAAWPGGRDTGFYVAKAVWPDVAKQSFRYIFATFWPGGGDCYMYWFLFISFYKWM